MKKTLLLLLLLPSFAFAQNVSDRFIHVEVSDTTNIYLKVKYALVNNDFNVKDDGIKDTLITYPAETKQFTGITVVKATINNNVITLSGVYGLKRLNDLGYYTLPKGYKNIIYYKGSKTWKQLEKIANEIGGNITYSK